MNRKPWEEYPDIWPTEAKFWTYVRGALRRALWNQSPIKIIFKNQNCEPPPEGYTGRAKSGQYCALSGQWEGKSKLQVDHQVGEVSLRSWEDILPFVQHLIPPPDSLQLVTEEAHKIKSHAERRGMTYEEALLDKKAIDIQKKRGYDTTWLKERGVEPASNAKLRKQQIIKILEDEYAG